MRIIVFFDLPTLTRENRRDYSRFRRMLIKSGFMMLQESVYCRMVLNHTIANSTISNIRKNKPSKGLVMVLEVTEKQFSKMEMITGDYFSEVIDNDKRLVIL